MQGQILGNRYELLEKVGGGGMALVYKAKCRLLNRFVAVKILRPEYTNDEEFVKRFLIEAQSVARLSHPNIVPIYDVGHEDNMHYLVMEYVQGITLKEYIVERGSLPWSDAVNISIQICSAIEHAHKNHIVHRDIKPHNIIITGDGIAKVTDFGIARAVSTSTITMVGNTIGSVHYFSPEQARGGYIGEKSDIYSMGICLYEMVTGKIPFDGETPVAVALKHIQEQPMAPIEINPKVPRALNDVIMKSIRKEQDRRYQTATAMLQDLYRVSKEPNGVFVRDVIPDDQQTKRVESVMTDTKGETKSNAPLKSEENSERAKKTSKKTIWLAIATSVVLIITFIVLTIMLLPPGQNKNAVEIKDYIGKNYQTVKADLEAHDIEVKITQKDDENEKDIIIDQSIQPGKTLKPNGFIELTVSKGPKMVEIPDLVKAEYRSAESKLKELDLIPKIEEEFHTGIPEGYVTRTDPPYKSMVKSGSSVTIYKSKGPEIKDTKVPDLKGKTKTEAQAALAEANLNIGTITPADTSIALGKVIAQSPAAGTTVKEKTGVNITFELQPTPTPTPTPSKGTVQEKIVLREPSKYQDKIKVRVEYQLPDSNKTQLLMDETEDKEDFPITINIPVLDKGKTKVTVFLDNKLFESYYKSKE